MSRVEIRVGCSSVVGLGDIWLAVGGGDARLLAVRRCGGTGSGTVKNKKTKRFGTLMCEKNGREVSRGTVEYA
jgi:hypothetical protein